SIHPRNPARRPQEHLQCQRARPYFAFLAVEVTLSCPNVLLPVRNYGPLPWDPALVGSSVSSHSSDQEPLQELLTIALTSREPHSTWALPDRVKPFENVTLGLSVETFEMYPEVDCRRGCGKLGNAKRFPRR